jgi:hypothetical protein
MRKVAFVAGLAVCLGVAAAPRAFADDELMRRIQDRLEHLPRVPPPPALPTVGWVDALMSRLAQCWDVPAEIRKTRELAVSIRIDLKSDGSLAAPPVVINRGQNPLFAKAAESAVRAVRKCAPYTFLPAASYNQWKDIIVDFDPRVLTP